MLSSFGTQDSTSKTFISITILPSASIYLDQIDGVLEAVLVAAAQLQDASGELGPVARGDAQLARALHAHLILHQSHD